MQPLDPLDVLDDYFEISFANRYDGSIHSFPRIAPGLEQLWKDKKDKGLVVLGVPANNFGSQEPGTEAEIKTFCETRFNIDFPMTAKEDVIGANAHPMYKWLAGDLGEDAAPKWNFHKYLINKDGTIAGTFGPRTTPDDAAMNAEIDKALAK